jgi:hypothetical protein
MGATLGTLPWYDGETYDLGYQGLIDTSAMPDSPNVLVSVQRSSVVVVHDPETSRAVGRFDLAGRHGNPMLNVVGDELWTVDYDTFVRVNLATYDVRTSARIQNGTRSGRGESLQFVENPFVWEAAGKAAVPRPFSGDVAIIDPERGRIESLVPLGKQPLRCAVTRDGVVIARDWQSGEWLQGTIGRSVGRWWRRW